MGKNISAQKVVGNFRPYIYYIVVEKKSESVSNARAMHYTLRAKNDLKSTGNLKILSYNFFKVAHIEKKITREKKELVHPKLELLNIVVRTPLFTRLSLFTKSSLDK